MGRGFFPRPRAGGAVARWRRRAGVAVAALALLGCSGDPSGGSTGGGAGEGAAPVEVGGAGGAAGAGAGAGGAGGAQVAPSIESLTSDVTVVTELPITVTFFAQVTDPQGYADILGGNLNQGAAQVLGVFTPSDDAGGYQLALAIDESRGWDGNVTFLATFRDHDGNEAERSKVIQFDLGGCSQEPDYESCRACYCEADPAGCASYTSREHHHLYCGNACSQTCLAFCETVYDGQPDPTLISPLCEACEPSNDDVAAFQQSCLADIPDCFGFFVDMGHCTPRTLP